MRCERAGGQSMQVGVWNNCISPWTGQEVIQTSDTILRNAHRLRKVTFGGCIWRLGKRGVAEGNRGPSHRH